MSLALLIEHLASWPSFALYLKRGLLHVSDAVGPAMILLVVRVRWSVFLVTKSVIVEYLLLSLNSELLSSY